MAIAKIDQYLAKNNRNYLEGRMLYEQYGESKPLLALFKAGTGAYHFRRLLEALTELSVTSSEVVEPIQSKPRGIPSLDEFSGEVRDVTTKPDYFSLPDQMKAVTTKKNQHYRRANQLFIEIGFTTDENERLEMALVMLDDYEEVQKCWAIIDGYRETGKLMVETEKSLSDIVNALTIEKLSKMAKNLPTYISKDRAKLETMADGPKKAKILARLRENGIKLELLTKRLKELSNG